MIQEPHNEVEREQISEVNRSVEYTITCTQLSFRKSQAHYYLAPANRIYLVRSVRLWDKKGAKGVERTEKSWKWMEDTYVE